MIIIDTPTYSILALLLHNAVAAYAAAAAGCDETLLQFLSLPVAVVCVYFLVGIQFAVEHTICILLIKSFYIVETCSVCGLGNDGCDAQ